MDSQTERVEVNLDKTPERVGVGGTAAFREAMATELRMAVAQARQVSGEAGQVKLPTVELRSDVWPPHFRAGTKVEFDPCSLEAIKMADFVIVQTNRGPAIRRFVRWHYEGDRVSLVVLPHANSKATETLPGPAFLGVVVQAIREKRITLPNKRSLLEQTVSLLTSCGTSGPIKELRELIRDILLVMETRKSTKVREKSFWEALREVREYHRHCEQQEALIKAERLAALKKQQEEERKAAAAAGSGSVP